MSGAYSLRPSRMAAILLFVLLAGPAILSPKVNATEAKTAVQAVAMIGFTVSDMERATTFYQSILDFEKVLDTEVAGPELENLTGVFASRVRIVHLRLGDQILELIQFIAPPDGRPITVPSHSNDLWFEHMAIVVSDMDKAYALLRKHKVRQISPEPQTIPPSNTVAAGIQALKFRDPDGHDLELLAFPTDKGADIWHQDVGDKIFLGIDHTAITISNTDQSLAFYRDLLGMKVGQRSLNTGPTQWRLDGLQNARVHVTPVLPQHAPPHVEFLQYEQPGNGRPMPDDSQATDIWHWQISVQVDNVEAVANALLRAGVRPVSKSVTTVAQTELGFSKAFMVRDPDGHVIRLMENSSHQPKELSQ